MNSTKKPQRQPMPTAESHMNKTSRISSRRQVPWTPPEERIRDRPTPPGCNRPRATHKGGRANIDHRGKSRGLNRTVREGGGGGPAPRTGTGMGARRWCMPGQETVRAGKMAVIGASSWRSVERRSKTRARMAAWTACRAREASATRLACRACSARAAATAGSGWGGGGGRWRSAQRCAQTA